MKGIFVSLFLSSMVTLAVSAAKVVPVDMKITLANGNTEMVHAVGDERLCLYVNGDNKIYLCDNGVWHAATQQELDSIDNIRQELDAQSLSAKSLMAEAYAAADFDMFSEAAMAKQIRFPHKGTPKVLVLMVDFPDRKFTFTREELEEQLNGTAYIAKSPYSVGISYYNYSSVAQYFSDCSGGLFRPQFDLHGVYTLPGNSNTYRERVSDAVKDAMNQAKAAGVDFSQYDSDNDGVIDLVYLLHAGYSSQYGGDYGYNAGTMWSSCVRGLDGVYDGKRVEMALVKCELSLDANSTARYGRPLSSMGVTCHEFSHALGLVDIYPTVPTTEGWITPDYDNQSMEDWDLMDNGSNIFAGFAPVPYTAAEKAIMGWTEPIETLAEPADITMKPLVDGGKAYRVVNDNDPNEAWVLEVMPKASTDSWYRGIPNTANGLLITHAVYDATKTQTNSINNTKGKPCLTVLPADGMLYTSWRRSSAAYYYYLSADEYNESLCGDLFPGTTRLTTLPSWKAYTDNDKMALKKIENIKLNADGSISFRFMGGMVKGDVNRDRVVNMEDANMVVNYCVGNITDIANPKAADVDGDGRITKADANGIIDIYLKVR